MVENVLVKAQKEGSSKSWNSSDYNKGRTVIMKDIETKVVITTDKMEELSEFKDAHIETVVRQHGVEALGSALVDLGIIKSGVVDEYTKTYKCYHLM